MFKIKKNSDGTYSDETGTYHHKTVEGLISDIMELLRINYRNSDLDKVLDNGGTIEPIRAMYSGYLSWQEVPVNDWYCKNCNAKNPVKREKCWVCWVKRT